MSLVIDFLASAGDVIARAGGVDPLGAVLVGASLGDAYRHSLSDLIHVAQRGLCSSHLMRRDLQVRLVTISFGSAEQKLIGEREVGTGFHQERVASKGGLEWWSQY